MTEWEDHLIVDIGACNARRTYSEDINLFLSLSSAINEDTSSVITSLSLLNYKETPYYRPVQNGRIVNKDGIEVILNNLIDKKKTDSKGIVYICDPSTPKTDQEFLYEILFEKYNFDKVCLETGSCLGLYAAGRTSGLSFASGHSKTNVLGIYEGCLIPNSFKTSFLGSSSVSEELVSLYNQKQNSSSKTKLDLLHHESEIHRIKRELCFLSLNSKVDNEQQLFGNSLCTTFRLPDNTKINLDTERINSAEILLKYSSKANICELIKASLDACPRGTRADFRENILCYGGSTMLYNFKERLEKDLKNYFPALSKIKVLCPSDRYYRALLGAEIIAKMSYFQPFLTTREKYMAEGESIVHKIGLTCLSQLQNSF